MTSLSTRAAVLALLDALADQSLGYTHATLFEVSSHGATETLRAWANARGYEVREQPLVVGDREVQVASVTLPSGTWLEIQR